VELSKIQGMKSISQPRWPIEIYTFWQNLLIGHFRKEHSIWHLLNTLHKEMSFLSISLPPYGIFNHFWVAPLAGMTE
jgi:hypothetical protein